MSAHLLVQWQARCVLGKNRFGEKRTLPSWWWKLSAVAALFSLLFGVLEVASGDVVSGLFRLLLAGVLAWLAVDLRRKQMTLP